MFQNLYHVDLHKHDFTQIQILMKAIDTKIMENTTQWSHVYFDELLTSL